MPDLTHTNTPWRSAPAAALALLLLACGAQTASAQAEEYNLGSSRTWEAVDPVAPSPDERTIADARRALADDDPGRAHSILTSWLDANADAPSPLVPEAYLLRGDALLAMDKEFKALFDYEAVIKGYPQSDSFRIAVERELEIGLDYAGGKARRWLGLRLGDSEDIAVEILIRVQERMPGSALAEKAAITLADYYFDRQDMDLAREAYDLYLINHPNGANRMRATSRRIYAEVARFKGPRYDAAGLLNARVRIEDFAARFPAEADKTGLNEAMSSRIDESLAAQYLDTASWYLRVDDEASARFALRRLIKDYPQTLAAQEALGIMQQRGWVAPPPPTTDTTSTHADPSTADTDISSDSGSDAQAVAGETK